MKKYKVGQILKISLNMDMVKSYLPLVKDNVIYTLITDIDKNEYTMYYIHNGVSVKGGLEESMLYSVEVYRDV